jgi:hypothetical protein
MDLKVRNLISVNIAQLAFSHRFPHLASLKTIIYEESKITTTIRKKLKTDVVNISGVFLN